MPPGEETIAAISERLGERSLVWFGVRGDDSRSLLAIPQFRHSFAINAPLHAGTETDFTLEELSGQRVDLHTYDMDADRRPELSTLRHELLFRLRQPTVLTAYRPSRLLSAVRFASLDTTEYLGPLRLQQAPFEYKPWVESELRALGIKTISWRYVADEHVDLFCDGLDGQRVVLRPSHSSGGAGIHVVDGPDEARRLWPRTAEGLVAVAPYLVDAIPVNVGATVYDPRTITLQPASVQLIGIPSCTSRPLEYCGNDFAAFGRLDRPARAEIEVATRTAGRWLGEQGYRGGFGVDFLVDGDCTYFTEINPRLQGSTSLSAALADETGHVGPVIDHVNALLGLPPPESLTLEDWLADLPAASHLVVYNQAGVHNGPVTMPPIDQGIPQLDGVVPELLPGPRIVIAPNAILSRLVMRRSVTSDGLSVDAEVAAAASYVAGLARPAKPL